MDTKSLKQVENVSAIIDLEKNYWTFWEMHIVLAISEENQLFFIFIRTFGLHISKF